MAAINGFLLILKNTATFAFTRGLGGIFNLLGKLTVCVLNCTACYFMIVYWPEVYDRIQSPIGPLVVVFAISYCIATLFMTIYTTTATCMLHCLFADIDICNQMNYD